MIFLRRIPALLLAVTLALAVGIVPAPTQLWAAPAAQADEPAMMGYYESDIIPGEGDTPDLVVGLVLYEDGTAEVISNYGDSTDVITEVGTWVDNGDGTLTLTVTGTTDGDYAASIDLDFNIEEDGSLVVPGAPNGAFGEAGLILKPSALGNSETILAQIPSEALVFQSEVMPAASSPGMQLTLALFDDNSLTLVSDYMNPGEIVVEVGTWDEAEDGSLLVTLTGQIEAGSDEVTEYEAPLEFVFTLNEDNSLSLVDEDGALFGEAGLTLYPTEATGAALDATSEGEATNAEATPAATEEADEEAGGEATPEPTEEAAEEPTAEATPAPTEEATSDVSETTPLTGTTTGATTGTITSTITGTVPSGVYISDLLPSQDGSGTFLVTIFYDDGNILFSTYPLNGEPPITEVGSWSDNGDGTYLITATGTLDEEYDEPFEVDFTLDEDGIVTIAGVPLYPLANINLAAAPTLVAAYQSDVITDTIEMSHTLTLVAYDDSSVELTTEYAGDGAGYTEYGEWEVDESTDQLTITLTGDDEVEYPEPIVWVFDITEDDTLVLANDEDGYYGEDGLTLFAIEIAEEEMSDTAEAAAESGSEGATEETDAEETPAADTEEVDTSSDETGGTATIAEGIQLFQSEVLPAASSPGLQLTLGLLDDGSAALDYDYLNGEAVITNLGQWTDNGDGTLTITLTEGPSGTLELPVEFTLELDDEGNLVIIDASEESVGFLDVVLAPVVLE